MFFEWHITTVWKNCLGFLLDGFKYICFVAYLSFQSSACLFLVMNQSLLSNVTHWRRQYKCKTWCTSRWGIFWVMMAQGIVVFSQFLQNNCHSPDFKVSSYCEEFEEFSRNDIAAGFIQHIHQLPNMRFLPNCQLPVSGLCSGQSVGQYIPHWYYRIIYTASLHMRKSIAIRGIRENNIPIWFTIWGFYLQSDR